MHLRRRSRPKHISPPGERSTELMNWLKTNKPALYAQVVQLPMGYFLHRMNQETGMNIPPASKMDDACYHWLQRLKELQPKSAQ